MNKQLRERLRIPDNPLRISEAQMQRAIFAELQIYQSHYPALGHVIHIPNEGKRSNIGGNLAKRGGLTPGVLDMTALTGRRWALELKVGDNQPTPAQSWWMNELHRGHGGIVGLAYDIEEAVAFILGMYSDRDKPLTTAAWRAIEWLTILEERGYGFVDPRQAGTDKTRAW